MNAHDAARLLEAAGIVWLTKHQAAAHARVSWRTIDRWRKEGLDSKHSAGAKGKVLIRRDKLDEFIETL